MVRFPLTWRRSTARKSRSRPFRPLLTGSWREWPPGENRPLDPVYPVIFIDCVKVKIREGNVANRPIYVALAVTVEGTRDILGLWAGEHGDGEGAKYWMRVLSEIKNRGTQDCLIVVCDGLKGLPEAIAAVWPQTIEAYSRVAPEVERDNC